MAIPKQRWQVWNGMDGLVNQVLTYTTTGLHAGYADIRYGAMAPRSAAEAFVQHDSESDSADHPEIRFAISMNEYPWVLANSLLTLGREPKPDNGYNNRPRMQEIMVSKFQDGSCRIYIYITKEPGFTTHSMMHCDNLKIDILRLHKWNHQ